MLGTRSAIGKVSHFPLFGQTQFTQLTAAIILRSLLFFDYAPRFPPCPALSIVRSHSVHLCSRCAKPNYMACNKGRSKFSYNLWEQRIKKRGRRGRGSEQKKQLQNGMLYAMRPFPLRRRLINISNPSQNAATTRRANSPRMRVHLFWSHFICSLALVASRAARLVIPAVNRPVDPVVTVATAAILNHVSIYVVSRDLRFFPSLPLARLESA